MRGVLAAGSVIAITVYFLTTVVSGVVALKTDSLIFAKDVQVVNGTAVVRDFAGWRIVYAKAGSTLNVSNAYILGLWYRPWTLPS